MSAFDSPVRLSCVTLMTFPTLTPEMRTSDWAPSAIAWLNSALTL